ncbi:dual specificity protein phosphatase family protein [Desulfonatronum sp. SC1]|uniref:phosphatase domain-containing putative toxin n=1 Tax=Desulfonatronum sp. SC1 TaxID=2109626 RepID=UPI000D303736|nr:dual specificity protein phosphatase family protein [Desulfonatronum sp. SC1]PTN37191.1 phosphatase [Desulfonatronum sp. SC1]
MSDTGTYPVYWVTPNLATGPAPMSYDHLDHLRTEGVDAILNLCAEYCDLHDIESSQGFEVHYLPVEDEETPQLQALEEALAWLDEAIYLGKKVYVHCRHGIGRTGTVISAYLLRRGLGSKLVKQKLKKLRSQPANFDQWWLVRKIGKKEGRLTIREPSLEWKTLVDLGPFFTDHELLLSEANQRVERQVPNPEFCGLDHIRCCTRHLEVSLIEAAYLTHHLNRKLRSADRLAAIERSVETTRSIRALRRETREEDLPPRFAEVGLFCPLLSEGRCLVYPSRPLACRLDGLPSVPENEVFLKALQSRTEQLSQGLFLALTGDFCKRPRVRFPLVDVVSGRFVQSFFHLLSGQGGSLQAETTVPPGGTEETTGKPRENPF